MKKLAIDARESGSSTGRYIDNLVKYLAKLNPDLEIVLLVKPHRSEHFKQIAPNFKIIESPYKEFTFSEQLGFWRQLNKLKPDLVHFGMTQQPILYQGKAVTTIHDLTTARFYNPSKNLVIFKIKQFTYKQVIKIVAKKSARIITGSNFVKQDLVNFTGINGGKIKVIYEAADKIDEPSQAVKELENAQYLMYVGRPQPHKNLKRLMQAYLKLKPKHPNLKLVLVGRKDSLYEQLQNYAKQINAGDDVIFTGFVSERTLRWLYEHTAAYVFASLSEGFGLPGLEAMAQSAPVVSSSATCLPEIYGPAAHYFDPTNVDDIAAKIDEVLESPKLRHQLIKSGKEQVQKYSWAKTAEQTLKIYTEVLEK